MSRENCIQNMLDLSTAHLPSPSPEFGDLRHSWGEYGVIVFVHPIEDDDDEFIMPEWFKPIYILAMKHDCILVNFDQDAEISPLFAAYDR